MAFLWLIDQSFKGISGIDVADALAVAEQAQFKLLAQREMANVPNAARHVA
jgi:hypothetical protein